MERVCEKYSCWSLVNNDFDSKLLFSFLILWRNVGLNLVEICPVKFGLRLKFSLNLSF